MQFHQGSRLKNFVEKSYLSVKEIAEKSGIARSSLYDLYEKPEILPSKVGPILDVLNITQDRFYAKKLVPETSTLENDEIGFGVENVQLKKMISLLQLQVEQQTTIIELLKKKK